MLRSSIFEKQSPKPAIITYEGHLV